MKPVVAKYGGTSVANLKQTLSIITSNPHQKVIVVSAPGKQTPSDKKVTDLLLQYCQKNDAELLKQILGRFEAIGASKAILQDINTVISGSHSKNLLVSRGEYFAARIIAEKIGYDFVDATVLFRFSKAGILDMPTSEKLVIKALGDTKKNKTVVPGFYGSDSSGAIHLFGRGGSDRTGALLARILGYDYENWTDVDGIYSADPRIVGEKTIPISEITIAEIREGANGGAQVLMGDTIFDLHNSAVTTTVKNTFKPDHNGTKVLQNRKSLPGQAVIGVAGYDDLVKLEVRRFGLNKIPGYVHQLLAHFSTETMPVEERISIEYLPMGIDALSVAVRTAELTPKQEQRLHDLPKNIATDPALKPDNSLQWRPMAVVYLVGQALLDKRIRTQAHHRATGALIQQNLYFEDDISDASSPSIAFLLDRSSMKPAIKALHAEFF